MQQGEIVGLLGPNGAGKTTTMRILTCFFPPTTGSASVAGYDVVSEPDEVRRVIGYMPEGVPLYKDMTVADYLDFVGHSKGYKRAARAKFVSEAMEETNLGDVRNRMVGELSKGFRQRVGLAQAILGEPKVLILDEPTSGLDPRQIADMRNLIRGMAGRRTVIISTHILPEVQMTCSRVIIINRGKIAASGTPEKLTTRMQNRFQVLARVIGPVEQVSGALSGLPGVLDVSHREARDADEGFVRGHSGLSHEFTVTSGIDAPDLRPLVAKAVVENSWNLCELRQLGLTLEEIFLRAVAGDTVGQPGAASPIGAPANAEPKEVAKVAIDPSPEPEASKQAATSPLDETPPRGIPQIASAADAPVETAPPAEGEKAE